MKQASYDRGRQFGNACRRETRNFPLCRKASGQHDRSREEALGFLRLKQEGFKFKRQDPFSRYILDFYCHKAKLSIEIDGKYHDIPKQKELDEIRTIEIENRGIKEIRFTNEEVMNEFEAVKDSILAHLQ